MILKIYNTMLRKVETFTPIIEGKVGMYTCGPTVYHHAHIGNMRTYIASDTLVRTLRLIEYDVNHVMNITDVGHLTSDADEGEDKMSVGASRDGVSAWEIAERYTKSFFDQCKSLNIVRPNEVCAATHHISQQIVMIEKLEKEGFAYQTNDGVYFDTPKLPTYGEMARLDIEGLRAGARIEVGGKRNKTDFALWKFTRPGEDRQMEWESPWGRGFPGWHIECSAMSTHYLGDRIDIHTGGIDHIPVHHTNEIAQSECATGHKPFVNYWVHSNFLQMQNNVRMAKSSNEFVTVFSLLENGYDPLAFRFLCLKAHYRSAMKFSWEILDGAAVGYRRLKSAISAIKEASAEAGTDTVGEKAAQYETDISGALLNDMSTPMALTILQDAIDDEALSPEEKVAIVDKFDAVFGLDLLAESKDVEEEPEIDPETLELVRLRDEARANHNWSAADQLRDQLRQRGYEAIDTPEKTTLRRI